MRYKLQEMAPGVILASAGDGSRLITTHLRGVEPVFNHYADPPQQTEAWGAAERRHDGQGPTVSIDTSVVTEDREPIHYLVSTGGHVSIIPNPHAAAIAAMAAIAERHDGPASDVDDQGGVS